MNLNQAHQKVNEDRVKYTIDAVHASLALALHENNGHDIWGEKRIKRLLNNINERYNKIISGERTVEMEKQEAFEKTGVDLR